MKKIKMAKLTRRGKFDSQIESFKQLKSKADSDIQSMISNCGLTDSVDSIVKEIEEVLKQDQAKLRDDPGYQEAMKYRKKLIDAKRNFESANKIYQEKYARIFDSKVKKIDKLRHTEWKKSKQLEDVFHLYGSTLDEARAQNGENFDEQIKLVRENKKYQEALLAKKNLIKLKMALVEALNDYEKELDYNDEENNNEDIIRQVRKVRKVESPRKTLSTLGINYENVDGIILPTTIDGKKIEQGENSGNLKSIEEIKYANKILILFKKVFNDLGFTSNDYKVFVGKTNKNMVRKLPYIVVEFSKINKTIIVNNLYGESTFLCDNIFGNREYLNLSKEDLLKQYAETVTKVDYFDETSWSNQIELRLQQGKTYVNDNHDGENQNDFIETGGSLRKNRISGLTDEEEYDLFSRYRDLKDIAARDKIFHLYRDRLKIWLQRLLIKHENEYGFAEMDIDDLYQQSNLILLNAIEKFVKKLDDGKKFSVYLSDYYSRKMLEYLDDKFELVDTDFITHENPALVESVDDLGFQFRALSPKMQAKLEEDEESQEDRKNGVNSEQHTQGESDLDQDKQLLREELSRAISTLTQREQDVVIDFFGLNGESPMTIEEICEKFDLTNARFRQIREKALKKLNPDSRSKILDGYLDVLSPKKQDELLEEGESDQEDGDEENTKKGKNRVFAEVLSLLQDKSIESNPDKQQVLNSLKKEIERALSTLTQREQDVVIDFFGLNGEIPKTLEEIGEKYDITRERARQINEKAIRRLKHTSRSKIIRGYMGDL